MRTIAICITAAATCLIASGLAQSSPPAKTGGSAELKALARGVKSTEVASPPQAQPTPKEAKPAKRPLRRSIAERLPAADESTQDPLVRKRPRNVAAPRRLPMKAESPDETEPLEPEAKELQDDDEVELDAELEADLLAEGDPEFASHDEPAEEDEVGEAPPEELEDADAPASDSQDIDVELSESELDKLADAPEREKSPESETDADQLEAEAAEHRAAPSSPWKSPDGKRERTAKAASPKRRPLDKHDSSADQAPRELSSEETEIVLPVAKKARNVDDDKRGKPERISARANPLRKGKKKGPGSQSKAGANPLR